jgi:hypothetical protein
MYGEMSILKYNFESVVHFIFCSHEPIHIHAVTMYVTIATRVTRV